MKTSEKPRYVVVLTFWNGSIKLGWRNAEPMKKLVGLVKKLPIKEYKLFWSGGGPVETSGLVMDLGSNFFLEFGTKSAWEKAGKVLDKDDRFQFRDIQRTNLKLKWHRSYKFIQPAKGRAGK